MAGQMQPAHGPRRTWGARPDGGYPLPIRRELLDVTAWQLPTCVTVQITCDCAAVSTVSFAERPGGEFAVSCLGCDAPHWIALNGSTS